MAHEIERNDRVVVVGEQAWHGLGIVVKDAPTPLEALRLARMDWQVEQATLEASHEVLAMGDAGPVKTTVKTKVKSHVANLRSDDGTVLGVVSRRYQPIQNEAVARLIYEVAENERITVESAGTLRGGKDVWFLAHLGGFKIGERDESLTYALFTNAHDGSHPLTILPTTVRVVCRNTKVAAMSAAEERKMRVRVRHTTNALARIEEVRTVLRGAAAIAEAEERKARALAARRMTPAESEAFFTRIYERLYGAANLQNPKTQGEKSKATRALKRIGEWIGTYRSEQETLEQDGSAWLAANAVTKWIDHDRPAKGKTDRVHSNLMGSSALAKDRVFEEALALV